MFLLTTNGLLYTLPNLSPLEFQVEYGFKLEFQVEQLIRWESVIINLPKGLVSKIIHV